MSSKDSSSNGPLSSDNVASTFQGVQLAGVANIIAISKDAQNKCIELQCYVPTNEQDGIASIILRLFQKPSSRQYQEGDWLSFTANAMGFDERNTLIATISTHFFIPIEGEVPTSLDEAPLQFWTNVMIMSKDDQKKTFEARVSVYNNVKKLKQLITFQCDASRPHLHGLLGSVTKGRGISLVGNIIKIEGETNTIFLDVMSFNYLDVPSSKRKAEGSLPSSPFKIRPKTTK